MEAEQDSAQRWMARTLEVGRDELRLHCRLSQRPEMPQSGAFFHVFIEMPADDGADRGCLRCRTELVGTEQGEENSLLLRMRVHTMKLESTPHDSFPFVPSRKRVM